MLETKHTCTTSLQSFITGLLHLAAPHAIDQLHVRKHWMPQSYKSGLKVASATGLLFGLLQCNFPTNHTPTHWITYHLMCHIHASILCITPDDFILRVSQVIYAESSIYYNESCLYIDGKCELTNFCSFLSFLRGLGLYNFVV